MNIRPNLSKVDASVLTFALALLLTVILVFAGIQVATASDHGNHGEGHTPVSQPSSPVVDPSPTSTTPRCCEGRQPASSSHPRWLTPKMLESARNGKPLGIPLSDYSDTEHLVSTDKECSAYSCTTTYHYSDGTSDEDTVDYPRDIVEQGF